MNRPLKISVSIVGVLIAIVVGATVWVSMLDFNQYKGEITQAVKDATGRELTISGDIGLAISLSPALQLEGITFSNADWGTRKDMVTLKQIEAQVSILPLLSGTVEVQRLVLIGVDALLETDPKGMGNWEFKTAKMDKEEAPSEPDTDKAGSLPVVHNVLFEDVKVTYKDGKSGEATVVNIETLSARANGISSPLDFNVALQFNDAPIEIMGQVGPISDILSSEQPYLIKITAKAFEAVASVTGSIADVQAVKGIDMKIEAKIAALDKTLTAVGKALPALRDAGPFPPTSIDFTAQVLDTKGGYKIEGLSLKAGSSDLSGNAMALLSGETPNVTLDLASNLIDLKDFGVSSQKPASNEKDTTDKAKVDKTTPDKGKKVFPTTPLPLDSLRGTDAVVSFKGKKLLADPVTASNIDIKVVLKNGKLTVRPLDVSLAGGAISGAVSLDASKGKSAQLDVDMMVSKLVLGDLVMAVTGEQIISGAPTDATVKLKGSGGTVAEIMARLNGFALVEVGKGVIDNAYIDLAGGDLVSQGLGALSGKKKNTTLSCMVFNGKVKDGLMTIDEGIGIETETMLVKGDGEVNLKDEKLTLRIRPTMNQKVGVSAGGLATLVKLTGTLAEPTVGIDEIGAAKTVGSVAAAVATGGLSLLAEKVADAATEDSHPCATALGQKPAAKDTQSKPSTEPEKKKDGNIGDTLKGLFGN